MLAGRIRQCICQQVERKVRVRRLTAWRGFQLRRRKVFPALLARWPDKHRTMCRATGLFTGQGAGKGCQIDKRNGRPIVGWHACAWRSIFT